ncbi:MAG: glycosyltransferase family A protein [Planctomycetota bacterium]
MKPELVNCIIPVYNRSRFLGEAVESVLSQTYRPIEIIIVDDGSTDDTPRQIRQLVGKAPDVIRSIRIKNSGPGGAREAGLRLSRGEYVQYLDSDDLLMHHKFEIQVKALRGNPECGVAYGITRLVDENGRELQCPYKASGEKRDFLFPGLLVDRWWNTHTPLYRRSVCKAVGFWTNMRMGEDYEYDARVGAMGTRLVFCNEIVSCHRDHKGGRLTRGVLTKAILRDHVRLIPKLYECAMKAGVQKDCKEMQHFSRWAFLVARQAGAVGLIDGAKNCFEAATSAALTEDITMKIIGLTARIAGWGVTGRLCLLRDLLDKIRLK